MIEAGRKQRMHLDRVHLPFLENLDEGAGLQFGAAAPEAAGDDPDAGHGGGRLDHGCHEIFKSELTSREIMLRACALSVEKRQNGRTDKESTKCLSVDLSSRPQANIP